MTDAPQPQASDGPAPADDAAHLLIVDDDRRIRELLRRYLLAEGYRVTTAGTAAEATTAMRNMAFDLVVLDVMMPGEDGFTFATRLRGDPGPLAQRGDPHAYRQDRVRGAGARLRDRRRRLPRQAVRAARAVACASPRSCAARGHPSTPACPTQVQFGPFSFDIDRGELRENGEVVRITEREREMLRLLSGNAGGTVSREALSGQGGAGNERTIDVQVNRLRRKIEADPANPLYLQTVRGAGYRLLVDR